MARRIPGLKGSNFSLSDSLADSEAIAAKRKEEREETLRGITKSRIPGSATFPASLDEDTGKVQSVGDQPFLETIHVAQVANKPDNPANYGQGPSGSTRLCSHKFVIDQPMFNIYGANIGFIYVRFHKRGKRGTDWAYGPVNIEIYKNFANSNSKGHFINTTLNSMGHRPASSEEVGKYFGDFDPSSGSDSQGIRLNA